jgi:hypothetical protein
LVGLSLQEFCCFSCPFCKELAAICSTNSQLRGLAELSGSLFFVWAILDSNQ